MLGIVQGVTEFLPVSSSGHLVVVPAVLGWDQPSLTFDLVLHLGTLVAVVFAFRRQLAALAIGFVGRGPDPAGARRLVRLLAIATVPAVVLGVALGSFFEDLFDRPLAVCGFWVVTAFILLGAEHIAARASGEQPLDDRRSLEVGGAQAVAIIPGISRSGSTIATGLAVGLRREEAARFSFLMSIPVIAGAVASKVPDVTSGRFDLTWSVAAGFLAAAVTGWAVIEWLLRYLRTHSLRVFAVYLLVAAPLAALVVVLR